MLHNRAFIRYCLKPIAHTWSDTHTEEIFKVWWLGCVNPRKEHDQITAFQVTQLTNGLSDTAITRVMLLPWRVYNIVYHMSPCVVHKDRHFRQVHNFSSLSGKIVRCPHEH